MNLQISAPWVGCLALVLSGALSAQAQGTFENLDFESANVSSYSSSNYIPTTNAIPGWTAYLGGTPQDYIYYNYETLSDAAVSLQGTNGIYQPIQGRFFVLLEATYLAPAAVTAAIGQTGKVPVTAQSLIFWGNTSLSGLASDMEVTFNDQLVSYSAIGSGSDYTIYGANISGFAGDTGQLLFTAFNNTYAEIDNIQFSSQFVPEPGEFGLSVLGALVLGWRVLRKRA
jgi:hypothetical protein